MKWVEGTQKAKPKLPLVGVRAGELAGKKLSHGMEKNLVSKNKKRKVRPLEGGESTAPTFIFSFFAFYFVLRMFLLPILAAQMGKN